MYWEVRQLVTAAITPIISFLDWGSFCVSEPRVIQITCGPFHLISLPKGLRMLNGPSLNMVVMASCFDNNSDGKLRNWTQMCNQQFSTDENNWKLKVSKM